MKTFIKLSFSIILLGSGLKQAHAQDKMIMRIKADTMPIKVLEIGSDEIKYRMWPVDDRMPIIVERKEKIRKIIFENGVVMKFTEDEFSDPTNYAHQRKMAIKIDPYGLVRGITSVAFEQSLKPGRSVELGLGIIGAGRIDGNEKYSGMLVRVGYKFINQPDYHLKGMRYTHILKGGYIRPEFVAAFYSSEFSRQYINHNNGQTFTYNDKYSNTAFAVMLNFGKQYVFDDFFVVDGFVGLGIGVANQNAVDVGRDIGSQPANSYTNYYGNGGRNFGFFTSSDGKMGMAIQAGLKVGILIGKKAK